jgi:uncharacterized protein YndB with AHSA1/START domain
LPRELTVSLLRKPFGTRRIHATPERVYDAITTADGIHNWWTQDADLDSAVGGFGEFRFQGGQVKARVAIAELEPQSRVTWKALSGGGPLDEWKDTTIMFELRSEGDETVVTLTHRGFTREDRGFALVTRGWGHFIQSLQKYIETGKGSPALVSSGCPCATAA